MVAISVKIIAIRYFSKPVQLHNITHQTEHATPFDVLFVSLSDENDHNNLLALSTVTFLNTHTHTGFDDRLCNQQCDAAHFLLFLKIPDENIFHVIVGNYSKLFLDLLFMFNLMSAATFGVFLCI